MFAVIISRIVKRIKIPVDLEVKTKNPLVKVTQHFINCVQNGLCPILASPGAARQLLPPDAFLLEPVTGEAVNRVMPASKSLFCKVADSRGPLLK